MDGDLAPAIRAPIGPVRTSRLDLRRFEPSDLDGPSEVSAKPEVWRHPYGRAFDRRETQWFLDQQLQHWDAFGFGCWVARLRVTRSVIGYVGLSVAAFLPEILPAVEPSRPGCTCSKLASGARTGPATAGER